MSIKVEAYLADGTMRGWLAGPGQLRDALEDAGGLQLERAAWTAIGAASAADAGSPTFAPDDVLIAVGDEEPVTPVHATWHPVSLVTGPWAVEGELPTMPGFDPGRALTRPSGEFVVLRDVRISSLERPGVEEAVAAHAYINRYAVERIRAELMLGFFFPGAALEATVGGVGVRP